MKKYWIIAAMGTALVLGGAGSVGAQDQRLTTTSFQRQVLTLLRGMDDKLGAIARNTQGHDHDRPQPAPQRQTPISPLMVSFATTGANVPFQPLTCRQSNCRAEALAFCDDMGYTAAAHVQTLTGGPTTRLTGMVCYVALP